MKKITNTLLLIAVITIGISSCGKDGTTTGTDVTDKYVGNWRTNDTVYDLVTPQTIPYVISFSIEKVDANKVLLLNFLDVDSSYANITDNSIVITSGATFASLTVINNAKFNHIHSSGPSYYYRGTSVKL